MCEKWKKIQVCRTDLHLNPTLNGGQSFRWKNLDNNIWIGVFKNRVWLLSQKDNNLSYQTFKKSTKMNGMEGENCSDNSEEETEQMLKNYFRLDVNLNHYYKEWSEADPYFREVAPKLYGVRILNQDVTENVFSFICSSNNNIERISTMVEKLCELYGDPITEVNEKTYKSFPSIEKLAENSVEEDLKKAGFGYRAKFVHKSACLIKDFGGSPWLESLKLLPYKDAKRNLMKLPGIGAKVADCICLMSLGHLEAVPVDTHVFQLAAKTYLPELGKYKSLTDKVYNKIGDHFRSIHGSYAGWANTVLAKKGSSSEEDRNGYDIPLGVWPYPRPGRAPKPFKIKGPKHQIFVVGRPQFQPQQQEQAFYPQLSESPLRPQFPSDIPFTQRPLFPTQPQFTHRPRFPTEPQLTHRPQFPSEPQFTHRPQFPTEPQFTHRPQFATEPQFTHRPQFSQGSEGINSEVQQYLEKVQREMQEFSAKAYKEFQRIENEIDRSKRNVENTLKSQFQTLELTLEAKQNKEIQQAVKEGKDEVKIQECLAEEERDFRNDMDGDIQRTTDCISDATERARKMVTDARNAFTETSIMSSMQAKEWAQKVKSCAEQRNNRCVQEGVALINGKTKSTVEEGSRYFEKLQDAPRQQMIQIDYCRGNFMEDLKEMREAYSQMVKRCVIASEIQEPEEDDEEEEKDEGKVNVNVEVKPQVEAEVAGEPEVGAEAEAVGESEVGAEAEIEV